MLGRDSVANKVSDADSYAEPTFTQSMNEKVQKLPKGLTIPVYNPDRSVFQYMWTSVKSLFCIRRKSDESPSPKAIFAPCPKTVYHIEQKPPVPPTLPAAQKKALSTVPFQSSRQVPVQSVEQRKSRWEITSPPLRYAPLPARANPNGIKRKMPDKELEKSISEKLFPERKVVVPKVEKPISEPKLKIPKVEQETPVAVPEEPSSESDIEDVRVKRTVRKVERVVPEQQKKPIMSIPDLSKCVRSEMDKVESSLRTMLNGKLNEFMEIRKSAFMEQLERRNRIKEMFLKRKRKTVDVDIQTERTTAPLKTTPEKESPKKKRVDVSPSAFLEDEGFHPSKFAPETAASKIVAKRPEITAPAVIPEPTKKVEEKKPEPKVEEKKPEPPKEEEKKKEEPKFLLGITSPTAPTPEPAPLRLTTSGLFGNLPKSPVEPPKLVITPSEKQPETPITPTEPKVTEPSKETPVNLFAAGTSIQGPSLFGLKKDESASLFGKEFEKPKEVKPPATPLTSKSTEKAEPAERAPEYPTPFMLGYQKKLEEKVEDEKKPGGFLVTDPPKPTGSLFGGITGAAPSTSPSKTETASQPQPAFGAGLFGQTTPTSTLFASANKPAETTGKPLFGASTATTEPTTSTLFSGAQTIGSGLFAGTSPAPSTTPAATTAAPAAGPFSSGNLFQPSSTTTPTGGNLFGQTPPSGTSNAPSSLFSATPTPPSTSLFGGSSNLFGGQAQTQAAPSFYGQPPATGLGSFNAPTGGLFGATPAPGGLQLGQQTTFGVPSPTSGPGSSGTENVFSMGKKKSKR